MTTTDLELPVSVNPQTWNADTTAMLEFAGLTWKNGDKREYAPAGVTAGFINACNRTGLDPTTKQIYAAQMSGKWTVLIGIDGMRTVAQRSHQYEGQTPIQWTADGVTWVDAWLPSDPTAKPLAARVGVYRTGFREPLMQVVTWAEFGMDSRFKGDNWGKRPAHMLGIRAESHALRRAFPNDLSGLYTAEDFDPDDEAMVIEPSEDWETLIEQAETKDQLVDYVNRAREVNELTDAVRTKALVKHGEFNRANEAFTGDPTKMTAEEAAELEGA